MTAGSISLLKSCIITVSLPNSGVRNSTAIVMCWGWIGTGRTSVTELRFQIEVCSMNVVSTEKARRIHLQGPENTSRVVGRAQGFIIPVEHFAHSAFNTIYLTFDMPEYSGCLNIQANQVHDKGREELTVVGGMGVFAFARGLAIFSESDHQLSMIEAMYHVKLRLKLPPH
ncbi:hypothetical protein IFM89_014544 [Coptis chinensis]|uniref:Dirigent protein n=1 Tax=Coptis chinensis TaxID=261450 RepID=A0A835LHY4_9MAGN|nr:hypothetical protein IFM89_014544 [Coptis chinensis]